MEGEGMGSGRREWERGEQRKKEKKGLEEERES